VPAEKHSLSPRKKLRKPSPRLGAVGVRFSARELMMMQELMDVEGVTASELVRRWLRAAHEANAAVLTKDQKRKRE
jgi:hypothetical protein